MRIRGVLPLLLAAVVGCQTSIEVDPRYRPAESILELLAVLQRHVPDDTYRFVPARDFTGRNVYRSSLLRLENLENLHADALRAGHMDGVIAFGKARALERLRAYDLAAEAYRLASERDDALAAEALHGAAVCDALHGAVEMPLLADGTATYEDPVSIASPALILDRYDARAARLEEIERDTDGTHHAFVAREELEHADVERARAFTRLRPLLVDGDVRAAAELQRVVRRHGDSKHAARHLLGLADLYTVLSEEYVERHPPETFEFDPAQFRDLVDSGARVYEMVASRDGTIEKVEASRRLEAFLAFALRVDRDRFTP